jgi:circadian clock protein KaiB
MKRKLPTSSAIELRLDESAQHYAFELYITGTLPKSNRALKELKTVCEHLLKGRYSLKVIDLLKEPARAAKAQVFAVPTLLRITPGPTRRLIGDLSAPGKGVENLLMIQLPGQKGA